jgi:hypothetical protein
MSRPVGTAMQAESGTDMICDMIRPELSKVTAPPLFGEGSAKKKSPVASWLAFRHVCVGVGVVEVAVQCKH